MAERSVMLAPRERIPFNSSWISYPMYGSWKYDGYRLLIKNGEFLTRNLRTPANRNLPLRFKELKNLSENSHLVFDCEIWSKDLKFNEIQSVLSSRFKSIPDNMYAYVFDMLTYEDWLKDTEPSFEERYLRYQNILRLYRPNNTVLVNQIELFRSEQARLMYEDAIERGLEGIMLRHPRSKYKHGRATLKEGTFLKFKEFETIDAVIVGFRQAEKMKDSVRLGERDRNPSGFLKRSYKQEDYELVESLGSLVVKLEDGITTKVCLPKGWTKRDKDYWWINRNKLLNRHITLIYMPMGSLDRPRIGRMLYFRKDLDK